MAAAVLGRMSRAAREKMLPGPGTRSLGALVRSLLLALLLVPVLCSGNGRGVAARVRGTERRRLTALLTRRVPAAGAGPGRLERSQCGLPRPDKWGRDIPGPEWVGGDGRWPSRGQSREEYAPWRKSAPGGCGRSPQCLRMGRSEVLRIGWETA